MSMTQIDPLRRSYIDEKRAKEAKETKRKEKLREELENDVANFLKNGGEITPLNPGESGYVVRGNKRAEHSNASTRNSTTAKSRKGSDIYEGHPCWNCGTTTRYLSNRGCVKCLKARNKSQKAGRENA